MGDRPNRSLNEFGLTQQQEIFCLEYHKTGIASKSYLKAYPTAKKWKDTTLYPRASELLNNSKVIARLDALNAETKKSVQKNVVLNKTKILEELVTLYEATKQSGASERGTSLNAIKLMAQIAKLIGESNTTVNITNVQSQTVGEVTDYLDL